jgi:hypothetical protein
MIKYTIGYTIAVFLRRLLCAVAFGVWQHSILAGIFMFGFVTSIESGND